MSQAAGFARLLPEYVQVKSHNTAVPSLSPFTATVDALCSHLWLCISNIMHSDARSKYTRDSEAPNAADVASSSSSQLLFVPTAPLCCSIKRVREAKDCN